MDHRGSLEEKRTLEEEISELITIFAALTTDTPMKRILAAVAAALLTNVFVCLAQAPVEMLYFEARAGFGLDFEADGTPHAGPSVDYLNFHAAGHLSPTVSYRLRQRFTKPLYSPDYPLNATDFLWLDWAPSGRWHFSAGKLPVLLGGFEWDTAPIDVYYWSGFCNHVAEVYALGLQAFWTLSKDHTITFQATQSPWSKGTWDCFAYNLGWYGQFAPWWKTIWTVNYMDDVRGGGMQYISLGNRFRAGKWALELDWMDREAFHRSQKSFSDYSIIGRLVYDAEKWNLFLKSGYDFNDGRNADAAGIPFDYNYPSGMEYVYAGGGAEYFPLGNRNLRLHFFLMTDNISKSLCMQTGLTWRFHLIDKQ